MCGYHVKPLTDHSRVEKKIDANAAVAMRRKREEAGANMSGVHEEEAPITRVWTVVSDLFQALSEARDELVTLMSSDSFRGLRNSTSASKAKEARSGSPCPAPRSSSAPVESLRRIYGHGAKAAEDTSAEYNPCEANGISYAAAGEYIAPVAFGMNLDFEGVQRGRSPPANSALQHQQQLPLPRATGHDPPQRSRPTTAGHGGAAATTTGASAAVTARSKALPVSRSAPGPPLVSDGHSVAPCPEGKRVCKAARYADLLRAEANQLRERRLAEKPMSRMGKPSWL